MNTHEELAYLLDVSSCSMILMGILTFLACMLISAPYGRYSISKGWGPLVNARLSWTMMESPNLWMPLVVYVYSPMHHLHMPVANKCLLFMFYLHYINRALIYPISFSGACSPMPIGVSLLAFIYCCWNSFTQALALCVVKAYPDEWIYDLRFCFGTLIFFIGLILNIHSDKTLLAIRSKKEGKDSHSKEYAIPTGGLFEYVSCANYGAGIFFFILSLYLSHSFSPYKRNNGVDRIRHCMLESACYSFRIIHIFKHRSSRISSSPVVSFKV